LDTERKSLSLELKGDTPGAFRAIFSTLNVVDHDQDVTLPGALTLGAPVIVGAYGHDSRALPTGKGVTGGEGDLVWVDGEFFLDTPQGEATYKTLKRLGDSQEWSYTFRVRDAEFGEKDGLPVRYLKSLDVFSVDPVLVGAGIGTQTASIKSYADEGEHALASVQLFVSRSKSLADLRAKDGRPLSPANRSRLAALHEALTTAGADIDQLLSETDPDKERGDLDRVYLDFLRASARLSGAPVGA